MKVLLTGGGSGGHVSPALSVADMLRHNYSDIELLYIAGSLTMEGSTGPSIEVKLVQPTGIPIKVIHAGKFKRGGLSWSTISRLWGVVPGIFDAWRAVRDFGPDVIFSSGGYVSLPVVIVGWLQRIPIVIHEQTAAVGLSNALSGRMATKVAITFPQSEVYFNKAKVVLTGNPIQSAIARPNLSAMAESELGQWLTNTDLPLLYVTGGGLGSHIINQTIEQSLPDLLSRYCLIHQCGAHAGFNDFDHLKQAASKLPPEQQSRYYVSQHFSAEQVGWIYTKASLVIARAGANTVLELAAAGLAAIFIPIPWVTHDEQTKNAQVLVEAGTAVILPEVELSVKSLGQLVATQMTAKQTMKDAQVKAKALVDGHATENLTALVLQTGGHAL